MYGKKKINMVLWLICLMLCGCTRREQLVEAEDSALFVQGAAEAAAVEEPDRDGGDILTENAVGLPIAAGTGTEEIPAETENAGAPQTIWVHVCGAVREPDVYELPAGSRVYEAVQAAGGFAEDADQSYVNQAQKLSDGVKLIIPTLEQTEELAAQTEQSAAGGIAGVEAPHEAENTGQTGGGMSAADGRIDINTASAAELCDIPGIGETRAAAIVAYRQEKGGFRSPEEIMNVSGIKEGTYEKIREFITVSGN